MQIEFEKSGEPKALIRKCFDLINNKKAKSLFILACDENHFSPDNLDHALKSIPVPLFGGIFPGILYGNQKFFKGSLIIGIDDSTVICKIPRLSDPDANHEELIEQLVPENNNTRTMIVLVDGLSKRINNLIKGLFNNFGLDFNYIGGGAGSLTMEQKPCLFTNDGMIEDHALIILLQAQSGVGVTHGWQSLAGPFQITEANQNMIISIDFTPAFDFYKEIIQPYLDETITPENFFSLAKNHPFGLTKLGAEKVVRDPIRVTSEGAIQCVGEISQGSYVHILTGSADSLVKAAKEALDKACQHYPGNFDNIPGLFIDCVSRVLFLEKEFSRELEAVQRPNSPLVGALTLGEIGNSGQDYLEFYNKTSVMGIINI